MTTTYKFRLYPKREQQDKLDLSLEVCRQTYNHLLSGLDERLCLCGCGKEVKIGNRYINGHNHTKHTEEFKQKLSKRQQGENNISKRTEVRRKQRNAKLINPTNYWLGKHRDNKFMKYIRTFSKGMTGKVHKQETKDNLSILKSKQTSEYIASGKLFNGNSKYRGYFWSNKNNKNIYYQSFYEKRCLEILELNNNILRFDRCKIILEYIKNNKVKRYIPDFEIEYINRDKEIIEVKPLKMIKYNQEKIEKLKEYCLQNNIFYSIHTEEQLDINTKVWKHKAENAGCVVIDVDPAYTTRDCSFCGTRNNKLELSQRKFVCKKCNTELPRDYNSALNIFVCGKELTTMEKSSNTYHSDKQEVSMKSEAPSVRVG